MDAPVDAGDGQRAASTPTTPEKSYQERLFAHCDLGQYEEISALLRNRRGLFVNCVDANGNTPMHVVQDLRCAELLLDSGGQAALNRQNRDSETPLMVCLRLGNEKLAGFYLDNGADVRPPNRYFQHCLHVAAHSGMAQVLDRLLAMRQLDPNQPDRMGNAVLHYAITFADKERALCMLARLLEESQVAVDAEDALGRTAFALAAQSANLPACRLLRDRGCDLCHADANGADALHVSAAVAGPAIVRYLVADLAFSVDRSDRLGRTALFYAVHHAAEDTAVELLSLGADANRTDRCGRTPVHVAAEKGIEGCLLRLLDAGGAELRLADSRGQTPLHLAAAAGRKPTVKRLLLRCEQASLDDFLEARDADGKTARDLALEAGHQQVAQLLAGRKAPAPASGHPRPRSAAGASKARAKAEAEAEEAEKRRRAERHEREEKKRQEEEETEEKRTMAEANSTTEKALVQEQEITESAGGEDNADGDNKNRTDDIRVDGDAEQPPPASPPTSPQPEPQPQQRRASRSPSLSSSSSSSSTSPARGRPLEEELHGDRRAREAEESRDDPYLTAQPAWISGAPAKPPADQERPRQRQRLHRSQKVAPNVAALRRRLYMYDSTVMLGRMMNEERRERMHMRGQTRQPQPPPAGGSCQHKPRPRHRRQTRPSTAADVERLTDRYRDINTETRQLLDKWKAENQQGDSGGATSSRPVSGRGSPRPRSSSERSETRHPPYRRPQSGSRFLDYFPNNRQQRQAAPFCGNDGGEGARRGGSRGRGRRVKSGKR